MSCGQDEPSGVRCANALSETAQQQSQDKPGVIQTQTEQHSLLPGRKHVHGGTWDPGGRQKSHLDWGPRVLGWLC